MAAVEQSARSIRTQSNWRGLRAMTRRPEFTQVKEGAIAVGAALVVWEIIGRLLEFPFLPPFSAVFDHLIGMISEGMILANVGRSLVNLSIGFAIALVIALVVGMPMGANRKIYSSLDIYVNVLMTVPAIIFAPILFTLFGLGSPVIIGVVTLFCAPIMIITTADAVRTVDKQLVEMGRMLGARRLDLFGRVIFPASLPFMMAGFRLGLGRAVKGMINAEMFIAAIGLGAIVQNAGSRFDAVEVLAVVLVILIVAVAVDQIATAVERRITSWMPSSERG